MIEFYKVGRDIYVRWELTGDYEGDQEITWLRDGNGKSFLFLATAYDEFYERVTDWADSYSNRLYGSQGNKLLISNYDEDVIYCFCVLGNINFQVITNYVILNDDFFEAGYCLDIPVYAFKGTGYYNLPGRSGMTPPGKANFYDEHLAYYQELQPSSPLSTPTGLNADNITSNSATISWTAVENASGYKVEYRRQGDTTWNE